MSELAASLLIGLARTTLLLLTAALIVQVLLWAARCSSPRVHRVAWCLVLLQGWLFLRLPVAIPYYEAVPGRVDGVSELAYDDRWQPEPTAAVSRQMPAASDVGSGVVRPESSLAEVGWAEPAGPLPPARPALQSSRVYEVHQVSFPCRRDRTGVLRTPYPMLLLAGWLAGMGVLVARSLIWYVRFVRRLPAGRPADESWVRQWESMLAAEGIRQPIPLRMTVNLGPVLCRMPNGWRLFLPAELWRALGPDGRLAILRHELAHLKRHDTWTSLVVRLVGPCRTGSIRPPGGPCGSSRRPPSGPAT